ncbi:MAG: RNA-binding S4 domain-containing protein [Candidatus Omnitrophota bacterium]
MEFKLKTEFIELDNLLKVSELVSCGSEAKREILQGRIMVNGQIENRIRRKIRPGDIVEFNKEEIIVLK